MSTTRMPWILQSFLQIQLFAIEQNHEAVALRVGLADNAQMTARERLDQMHDIPSTLCSAMIGRPDTAGWHAFAQLRRYKHAIRAGRVAC